MAAVTAIVLVIVSAWAGLANAQTTLGEILDKGAKRLPAEDFRKEIVHRLIAGTLASGAQIEYMYSGSGRITGTGYEPMEYRRMGIQGEWKIDDKERICATMSVGGAPRDLLLPTRCQFWFKLQDQYYLSDSDYDRSAKVLERRLSAFPAPAATTLGQLLDAGGKLVASDEFRRDVVQRLLVGATPQGAIMEIMYTPAGTVQGVGGGGADAIRAAGTSGVSGEWKIDDRNRVCTTMTIGPGLRAGYAPITVPLQCQFWFKLGDKYYLADSDSDRSAKLAVRTPKQ